MKTLLQTQLLDRDFGRMAVTVEDLRAWAARERAQVPPTVPELAGFDAAHLESLLCAIERAIPQMPDEIAIELSAGIPCHEKVRRMIDEGDAQQARWLVGAEVPRQWRRRLGAAIDSGALRVIDALSGLPVEAQTEDGGEEAAPVAAAPPGKLWTPERKNEAQAYRDVHGHKATAEHYGVSPATITKHTTPKGGRKTKPTPFAGLGRGR